MSKPADTEISVRVLWFNDHSVTRHGVVLLCENAEGVEVIARVAELLPDVV
jgi:hypothetical protein